MRATKAIFLALTILLLSQCSSEEQPNGFMGQAWGTSLEDVRQDVNLVFIDQDQFMHTSTFESDIDEWQGIKLETCIFSFFDDQLYSVSMVAMGESSREELLSQLKTNFGEGSPRGSNSHTWLSFGSMANLYYNDSMNATFADVMSPIYSAKIQNRILETAMNSNGVEDF